MRRAARKIYKFCASIKLAVVVILALASTLAVATFYESAHGTKAAQRVIYGSWWFPLVLLALGVNVFCAAAIRYPWKRRQAGFLIAHIGILTILAGAFVTRNFGFDGNLALSVGETGADASEDRPRLELWDETTGRTLFSKNFDPAGKRVDDAHPIHFFLPDGNRLTIDRAYENAAADSELVEAPDGLAEAAVELEVGGKSIGFHAHQILMSGAGWMTMGLAQLAFTRAGEALPAPTSASSLLLIDRGGRFEYELRNHAGKHRGRLALGVLLPTGWRDFTATARRYLPHAERRVLYAPLPTDGSTSDPQPAIRVAVDGESGKSRAVWLGYGEKAEILIHGRPTLMAFTPRATRLPFQIHLDKFEVARYPGTNDPMTYTSQVHLLDEKRGVNRAVEITMNEPLTYLGYTFYQASFSQDSSGEPTVSVLSVGMDPGRWVKYVGSILLVMGIVVMYLNKRKAV